MIELKTAHDVLDYLEDPAQLKVDHVMIHPEAARALLDINTRNRTVTQGRVESLARTLREKRWQLINNGIAIDSEGDLLDGQHRLLAVVLANKPAEFYLHTGLAPSSRLVIDTGRARTIGDTLATAGYGRGQTNLGAAVTLLYRYEFQRSSFISATGGTIPHDVFLEYMQSTIDPERMRKADVDSTYIARQVRGFNRSGLAAVLYLASCRDIYAAAAFSERLRSGESLRSGDPELTLRNAVARISDRKRNTWHFCLYAKAWNMRRANKRIQILRFTDGEDVPDIM